MEQHQIFVAVSVVLLLWIVLKSKSSGCHCRCRLCQSGRCDQCNSQQCRKKSSCGCETMTRGPPGYRGHIYPRSDVRLQWGLRPPKFPDPTWSMRDNEEYPQNNMPNTQW
jgi:hypothetical protein